MYCRKCGAKNVEGADFCSLCHFELKKDGASPDKQIMTDNMAEDHNTKEREGEINSSSHSAFHGLLLGIWVLIIINLMRFLGGPGAYNAWHESQGSPHVPFIDFIGSAIEAIFWGVLKLGLNISVFIMFPIGLLLSINSLGGKDRVIAFLGIGIAVINIAIIIYNVAN